MATISIDLGTGESFAMNLLRMMAAAIDDAQESETVAAFVRGVRRAAPRRDAQPGYVFRWLRGRVRFVRDPNGIEHVRSPASMIAQAAAKGIAVGDCDDRTTLGAAVMLALGFPVALVLAAVRPSDPWQHVLFAYFDGREWVPMDPQETDRPGKIPLRAKRVQRFALADFRE